MQNKPSIKATIIDRGLKPKKSFGQNFMIDQRVNLIFAKAVASFGKDLPVVEIGAGTGSLTAHLLEQCPRVHAVERDRDLVPILRDQFSEAIARGHLVIHEADGARFDLSHVFLADDVGILVGNLPYHLTSSILILALNQMSSLKGAVFLVQKEVADRLLAGPNTKLYGFLTAVVKLGFSVERVAMVDRAAFWPVPKVDSTIIKLTVADRGLKQLESLQPFMVFVREIFQKRRKKLSTILSNKFTKEDFSTLGIDANLRPENLSPEQFLAMFLLTTKTARDDT